MYWHWDGRAYPAEATNLIRNLRTNFLKALSELAVCQDIWESWVNWKLEQDIQANKAHSGIFTLKLSQNTLRVGELGSWDDGESSSRITMPRTRKGLARTRGPQLRQIVSYAYFLCVVIASG